MFRIIAFIIILMAAPSFAQDAFRSQSRNVNNVPAPPLQIYVLKDGQQVGPVDTQKFSEILANPAAATSTYVWMAGMAEWQLASTVPQLQGIIASIGQEPSSDIAFQVADIQSYALGVWISDKFNWQQSEGVNRHAIVQMKLLPNGRFEGATLFFDMGKEDPAIEVSHEKGTWTISPDQSNAFKFDRNITFTSIIGTKVVSTGQLNDVFVITPNGPNSFVSKENISFVRVPEQP
ncbi:MAG: DUF4339 domain-containing protein [Paracoccaceae bacterium]